MAIAVANYCFSAVASSVKFPCSISYQRRLATSHTSLASANHKNQNFKSSPSTSKSSTTDVINPTFISPPFSLHFIIRFQSVLIQKESFLFFIFFWQRKFPGRSKDGRGETERSQSTAFKSFGAQRKDKKEFQFDSKEQLVTFLRIGVLMNIIQIIISILFFFLRSLRLILISE